MSSRPFDIKFASEVILHGKPERSILARTFPLEHKNGLVFVFADFTPGFTEEEAVIEILGEAGERLSNSLDATSHLQHRFEQALQAANERLAHVLDGDNILAKKLHIMLGAIRDNLFVFSATGQALALYMRRTPKGRVRVFDLFLNTVSEVGATKPERPFAAVLDGNVEAGDVLLLGTPNLATLANLEEMHPLLATLPPTSVLQTFDPLVPARGQLGVLLVQMRPEKEMAVGIAGQAGGKESMAALYHIETQTKRFLDVEAPEIRKAVRASLALLKDSGGHLHVNGLARALWHLLRATLESLKGLYTFLS